MDLLKSLILVSEKAANIARLCRQNEHLFKLLIQQKSDNEANPRFVQDFKTLADVLIQELVKNEIGQQFPELAESIKGEENNIFSNKLGETITVEIKGGETETSDLLQVVLNGDRQAADLLAFEVHKKVFLDQVNTENINQLEAECISNVGLSDLGIWIDPIDSTAEYINGIEQASNNGISLTGLGCVTVLLGVFDKKTNLPIIGVVNQPFVTQSENGMWKGRCFWGIESISSCPVIDSETRRKTVCVSSSENVEIIKKLEAKGYEIAEVSGAGYKILTVICGLADAYVLTKDSTFKWDTCGPQAILRSLGGDILVYKEAIDKQTIQSLKYNNNDEQKQNNNCNRGGIIAYRSETTLNDIIECLS